MRLTAAEEAATRPASGRGLASGRGWPLTRILPLAVAIAMFVVALLTTQVGLRILEERERHALASKAEVFLDALADTTVPLLDAGEAAVAERLSAKLFLRDALVEEQLVVRWSSNGAGGAGGAVELGAPAVAAATLEDLLDAAPSETPGRLALTLDSVRELALAAKSYSLSESAGSAGQLTIAAVLDTSEIHAAARGTERWALLVDLVLAAAAAALTYLGIRWALAPFDRMATALGSADSELSLGAAPRFSPELGRFEAAIKTRLETEAARNVALRDLGEKDRNALLAKLAAGLAHEVRNPLAGLLNAVSTMRRFGDDPQVRTETLDLVERGLHSIGRVADTMLATYRPSAGRAVFTADDLADLHLLIVPEVRHRRVSIVWRVEGFRPLEVDADALRQILLNLLLNACRASAEGGEIVFEVEQTPAESRFTIGDSGPGMPDSVLAFLVDGARLAPMVDSKGLGLWLVTRLLEDIGGRIKVESRSGRGTSVSVRLSIESAPLADDTAGRPDRPTPDG